MNLNHLTLAIVAVLALSGCQKAATATNPQEEGEQSSKPTELSESKSKEIPIQFQGTWSQDCSDDESSSILEIGPNTISYYESEGNIRAFAQRGDLEVATISELSGEGETWLSLSKFRLTNGNKTLLDVTNDSEPSYSRDKCEKADEKPDASSLKSNTSSSTPPQTTESKAILEEALSLDRSDEQYLSSLRKSIDKLIRNGSISEKPALILDDKTTFYIPTHDFEAFGSNVIAIEHRYNMEYLGGPPVYGISVLLDVKKDKYIINGISQTYKCEVTPLKGSYSDMESFVNSKLPTLQTDSLLEMACTTRV